ncbi:hypothetical protein BDW74DRAFT_168005 [Aspergillus multicolor]|uniref:uncharacterized protein n=1 Tax=Aspergillus multicolor TaxID=41759 RepID=UPI003CCE07DB
MAMLLRSLLLLLAGARIIGATLAKRGVQTDLSGGFCRNFKFGATIADNVLYMTGLSGAQLSADNDTSNNYLVTLDLSAKVNLREPANYKLSLIPPEAPTANGQAFWSNHENTTLFSYGGRGPLQFRVKSMVLTTLMHHLAYVNVPELQASYWLGGYQSSETTSSIFDATKRYASGMVQFNTTTGEFKLLEAPFTSVQEGALVYIPAGEQGVLICIGGEVPSVQDGINAQLMPNPWTSIQVYDIAGGHWYNQSTTGTITPRTQFCAAAVHEPGSSSFQIYVISGADLMTHTIIKGVSYLSIPSFTWYTAAGLTKGRMTHTCLNQNYGRQIFILGGRQAWADIGDAEAGCYKDAAFVYDAQSEIVLREYNPSLSGYVIPEETKEDLKAHQSPERWADEKLRVLFTDLMNKTASEAADEVRESSGSGDDSDAPSTAAIAGGVVGGVAGVVIVVALIYLFIRRRRKQRDEDADVVSELAGKNPSTSTRARARLSELGTGESEMRFVHELDSGNGDVSRGGQ